MANEPGSIVSQDGDIQITSSDDGAMLDLVSEELGVPVDQVAATLGIGGDQGEAKPSAQPGTATAPSGTTPAPTGTAPAGTPAPTAPSQEDLSAEGFSLRKFKRENLDLRTHLQQMESQVQWYANTLSQMLNGQIPINQAQGLAGQQGQQGVPQQGQIPDDGTAQFDIDPQIEGFLDHRLSGLEQRIFGAIQPLVQQAQATSTTAQRQWELAEHQRRTKEWLQRIDAEENEYAASPEGNGYRDVVSRYEDIQTKALTGLAKKGLIPPQEVQRLVTLNTVGMSQMAGYYGVPVPVFIHSFVQGIFEAAGVPPVQAAAAASAATGTMANGAPVNGNGNGNGAPQMRQGAQPSQAVQLAADALQSGAAGRSGGTSSVQTDPNSWEGAISALKAGRPVSRDFMDKLAKEGKLEDWTLMVIQMADGGA